MAAGSGGVGEHGRVSEHRRQHATRLLRVRHRLGRRQQRLGFDAERADDAELVEGDKDKGER